MKCYECGKSCQTEMLDYGVGRVEAWGYVSTDEDWREVSACCNAELMPDDWEKPEIEEDEG